MNDEHDSKLGLDWVSTAAGALAAVTTAVLLSTLGAAGTLIGAALGSVAATVGTALYKQGLARSQRKVREVALGRGGLPVAVAEELNDDSPGWKDRLRGLPWRRMGIAAVGIFAAVMIAISAFELLAGKPVSGITGGSDSDRRTTISQVGGGGGGQGDNQDQDAPDQPQQSGEPGQGATSAPVDPTDSPDPTAPTSPPAPSATPTAPPTSEPTTAPTQPPTPTEPAPTEPAPTAPAE